MRMLRKTATVAVAAALGLSLGACGEGRDGDVQFPDRTATETTGTTGTETTGTETTP